MSDAGDDDFEEQHVVVDHGSFTLKTGMCGSDRPWGVLRSIEDDVRLSTHDVLGANADRYERLVRRGLAAARPPGVGAPAELKVLCSEPYKLLGDQHSDMKRARERRAELFFESLQAQQYLTCGDAMMALYSTGRTGGLSCTMGYESCRVIPIIDGNVMHHAATRVHSRAGYTRAGRYLTLALQQQETCRHLSEDDARALKERACYVSREFGPERQGTSETPTWREIWRQGQDRDAAADRRRALVARGRQQAGTTTQLRRLGAADARRVDALLRPRARPGASVRLPDGSVLELGTEARCGAAERVFRDLAPAIYKAATTTGDTHDKPMLLHNVCLFGGTSLLRGAKRRVEADLKRSAAGYMRGRVKVVVATNERAVSAWVGGSILASLSTMQGSFISAAEYAEQGPRVVHAKAMGDVFL